MNWSEYSTLKSGSKVSFAADKVTTKEAVEEVQDSDGKVVQKAEKEVQVVPPGEAVYRAEKERQENILINREKELEKNRSKHLSAVI